jgi:hypothetical protein
MPDAKYRFSEQESYDHKIVDADDKTAIGQLRIKPSSILWKPKGHQKFYKVSLDRFREWIVKRGKVVNQ